MVRGMHLSACLLAAIAPLIQAQTYTKCDPLTVACPDEPALDAKSLSINFVGAKSLPGEWETENQGTVNFGSNGAELVVGKSGDSLNIISKFTVLFGSFEFKVKSAPGLGLVSSIALISSARDEIDWEVLGKEPNHIQSNYFGKGDDKVFNRGGTHAVENNQGRFVTYKIDWTSEYISWSIDGAVVRTLNYNDAQGGERFPQTPMHIKIGAWAAGDPLLNRPGTVEWAGKIDWSKGPFVMGVQSLNIVNYSPGKAYQYTDKSGSYKSIKVVDGSVNGNGGAAPPEPPPQTTKTSVAATPLPAVTTSASVPPKDTIPPVATVQTSLPSASNSTTKPLSTSLKPTASASQPPAKASSGAGYVLKTAFGFAVAPVLLVGAMVL